VETHVSHRGINKNIVGIFAMNEKMLLKHIQYGNIHVTLAKHLK
jgi:hypothetical protein